MKWRGREESENVEDRRSLGKTGLVIGGAGSILIVILGLIFGFDPRPFLNPQDGQPGQEETRPLDPGQEEAAHLVKVVLKDTEDVWTAQFRKMGKSYRKPTLVLFTGQVRSACGSADSAVGPFYCPSDEKVYIDLDFFRELKTRFHAPGEFAEAYVLAHEVGHHVQKLLGYSGRVHTHKGRMSDSVRLELQADYLAGVWAYHAQEMKNILETGDIKAALTAAKAIGDDTLQKKSRGYVIPDSFTHGTSQQRVRAFTRGIKTGDASPRALERFFTADEL
ncbi:MAG TPA: neutral zinc metallopeptidase [Gemmataceae bacterium]|nr:neutral zinc metallopeptidase [Gemmataceae bacterium]